MRSNDLKEVGVLIRNIFTPKTNAGQIVNKQNLDDDRANSDLLSFSDNPYAITSGVKAKYLAYGKFASEVAAIEHGLETMTNGHASERISPKKILDLTHPATLIHLGVSASDLIKRPYTIQDLMGHLARRQGFNSMIVPSPRVNGGQVLVLFRLGPTPCPPHPAAERGV